MSAPELLYGARTPGTFGLGAKPLGADTDGEVVLKQVHIHYALFELPMADVLPRLPTSLHPSVPAVIGVTVWRCDEGPLGAFGLAYVGLACRTGIKPRHLIHGAFCDNAEVAAWMERRYGLAARAARIRSLETYDRGWSQVEVDGRVVLDIASERTQPLVAGSTVKYSPVLNPAAFAAGPGLVQMEVAFDFRRVMRGVPRLNTYDAAAFGDASLRPQYPVSGTWAEVEVSLLPPRFKLDLNVPAETGGASRIS